MEEQWHWDIFRWWGLKSDLLKTIEQLWLKLSIFAKTRFWHTEQPIQLLLFPLLTRCLQNVLTFFLSQRANRKTITSKSTHHKEITRTWLFAENLRRQLHSQQPLPWCTLGPGYVKLTPLFWFLHGISWCMKLPNGSQDFGHSSRSILRW